jgi:hypothetical protein
VIEAGVRRDLIEPRAQGGGLGFALPLPGAQEGLLDDFFCVLQGAKHSVAMQGDRAAMGFEERPEGLVRRSAAREHGEKHDTKIFLTVAR